MHDAGTKRRAACRWDAGSFVITSEQPLARPTIACARCRVVHTERDWAALTPITQVDGADLSGVVRDWPAELVVVVRACVCGKPIARLMARDSAAAVA